MRLALGLIGSLTLVVAVASCGGSDEDEREKTDCSTVTPAAFANVEAFSTCQLCHRSDLMTLADRQDAPIGIDFDNYDSAKAWADKAAEEVAEGEMPPPEENITPLSDAAKAGLYAWVDCGTPP